MRSLDPNQMSELVIYDLTTDAVSVIFQTDALIEAPNWSLDGESLIYNQDGHLFRISTARGGRPSIIASTPLRDLNNDHVLDPNGQDIYVSSNDGHLYRVPLAGGAAVRVSNTDRDSEGFRHYLHGVSPDGRMLAYVGLVRRGEQVETRLYTLDLETGETRCLTDGAYPVDGPEYAHDGAYIYYNAEYADGPKGGAQVFRMRPDGTQVTQLTQDDRVNWFPHLSPDGTWLCYLSYPAGTLGHPADRDVTINIMSLDSGAIKVLDGFNGGQGSINVNSWSPCATKFAYVRYPKSAATENTPGGV